MGLFDSLTTGYLENFVKEAPKNISETLASRDIGQVATSILTPAGNAISQFATTSGLAIGTATKITNAISDSAATFNVSKIADVVSNPGLTSLLKAFGPVKPPAGGPPYENVLEQFASYTPLWTLCCLTPTQFNDPRTYRNSPSALKNVVISSGGRQDKQRVNTANGAPEYFIDNVSLATSLGGSAKTGNTNVTGFKFEVYEPYSLGIFLQSLQAAAINSGYPTYLNDCPYLLKLEIKGSKDDGSMYVGKDELTKYFTIKITKIEFKVDEAGSRYTVEASPMHHVGFSDLVNVLYQDLNATGMTVSEVLISGPQSVCNILNEQQLKRVNDGLATYPDLYEIVFPVDSSDTIGITGGTSTEILTAMADPKAEKTQRISAAKRESQAETFGQGTIGKSSMGFSETSGGNYNFKLAGDVVDDKGNIVRDNMTIDPKQRAVNFPPQTKITEVIQRIVLSSEYCVKALKEENVKNGFVDWFRIDVQVQLLEFDPKRNVRAKKYIYRVVPFEVSGAIFKNPSSAQPGEAKLQKIIAKRYDYLYTGQNNNILKFDLQFNGQFYTAISPSAMQNNANVSNKDTQNTSEEKTPQARIKQGDTQESVTSTAGSAPVKPNPLLTFPSATGEKTVEQMVADNFNQSFARSDDMINVKMDILGDPYYLSDSGINSNYLAEYGPNSQVKADGAMNWEGSEIFIYITWRNPIEPNLGDTGRGGLYNFPNGGKATPFSGIYKVTAVENKFSGGTFQQTLDLTRQPNQDADYEGQVKVAAENSLMYDTTKEEPPKSSVFDNTSDESDEDPLGPAPTPAGASAGEDQPTQRTINIDIRAEQQEARVSAYLEARASGQSEEQAQNISATVGNNVGAAALSRINI